MGTGKSAFLSSVLDELQLTNGDVGVGADRIAYAPQHPWIRAGSLKDNILFGRPLNTVHYNETLRVCCLHDDIEHFVDGEDTEIGEKGINLSGGQKARVSLARCVYSCAQMMLLDDPLSAVDPHVAKRLYNDVIRGMMKHKAVVRTFCVSMCVCGVCVCVFQIYTCVYMYTYVHIHIHSYIYICIYACVLVWHDHTHGSSVYSAVHLRVVMLCVCLVVYMDTCMFMYVHVCLCMLVYICVCVNVCLCVWLCVRVYIMYNVVCKSTQ